MTARAQSPSTDALTLAVFGRDGSGKAHGSAFSAADAALAAKAAELMGMRSLPVRTEADRALAAKLPRGRVFASGKAFVPFIKATLLTELQTAALNSGIAPLKLEGGADANGTGKPAAAKPAAAKPAAAVPAKPPTDKATAPVKQPCGWGDIQVGAIVLAAAAPKYLEWHECVVLVVEGEDRFNVRYCDYPNAPAFTCKRTEVGLLHPAYTPEPPLPPEPAAPAT